jgi:DNA invertase Pin-like site-specific DNA recombinase
MAAYGYARVSTNGQDLGAQEAELMAAGCAKVFKEKVSGAKTDRPELAKVIRRLEPGDVLVVTRLDRLARSTHDLLNVLATIGERQASFRSLKDTWADTTTPHGRLMLTVLGGLAEFERELIRARTGDGRVRAKARGVRFGRPAVLSAHQRQEAMQRLANGEAQADLARSYGVSQPTISRLRRTILAGLLALPLSAQAQPAFYPETAQSPVQRAETLSRALKAEREERERAGVICLKNDGKTPEPCEAWQQVQPRLSNPAAPTQHWLILAPAEYEKPYTGKLQEIRVPPETMRAICPKTAFPLTLACTYPTRDQSECLIIMVSDEIIRAAGWDPIVIRMHEESHCGGWPNHHPGMRAATPELVENWLAAKARVKISER